MAEQITGARILVVDDDPSMLHAVTRVLDRLHVVEAVAAPTAALERAVAFAPDVAVLDVHMPELNGFEVMKKLQRLCPDIDVIMMTGSTAEPEAHLIRAIDDGAFYFIQKPFDRRVLLTIVGRCLELRRLRQEKARRARHLERELAAARRFQEGLLPPTHASFGSLDVHARYRPCAELAGDFYHYARAGDEGFAIIVADVAGHGASAAMLTGIVKSAFDGTRADAHGPREVVHRVSTGMGDFDMCRFVTLFTARFDPARGTFTYVNAGHPPAILCRGDGSTVELAPTGPLVSPAFEDPEWETPEVPFGPDDELLVYTDGVVEIQSALGMFGRGRLLELLATCGHRGAARLDATLDAVAAFAGNRPYDDDVTLLSVGTR